MTSTPTTVRTAFLGPDAAGRGSRIRTTANGRQRTYPRSFEHGGPLHPERTHAHHVETFAREVLGIFVPVVTLVGTRRSGRRATQPGYVFTVDDGIGPETFRAMLSPHVGSEDARRIAETMTSDGPVSRSIAEGMAHEFALAAAAAELDD